jgi:hypothetical protein
MGRRKRSSIDVSFYAFIFLGTVYFSFLFLRVLRGFMEEFVTRVLLA